MPEEGVEMLSHNQVLTYEEILRLVRIFASLGVKKIKLTGGEPLIRRNIKDLIRGIKEIEGIDEVTLTTNGILLESQGAEVIKAGVTGINISLDTLDEAHYRAITRGGNVEDVRKGMNKVLACSQIPVKINCVPNDISEEEIRNLAELARRSRVAVRFIELMPIGMGKEQIEECNQQKRVSRILEEIYGPLTLYKGKIGNGPSVYYSLDGFQGKIGFISAMSHKFCHLCNRVRLTSEGILKTCLQYESGYDLLSILRNQGTDEEIKKMIEGAMNRKPQEHHFLDEDKEEKEQKLMSQIGG